MLVYWKYECFVMQMLYICVLCASCGSSQCYILNNVHFIDAGRGWKRHTPEPVSFSLPHPVAVSDLIICSSVVYLYVQMLLYSEGSGVNRVLVVLSGFSVRLLCFVQEKTLCRYGCINSFSALVLVCVYVMVMISA